MERGVVFKSLYSDYSYGPIELLCYLSTYTKQDELKVIR